MTGTVAPGGHKDRGFVVQAKRWIGERTFGWLNRERRLSKDYERKQESSEAFIHLATLSEVIDHYAADGRASAQGGALSPIQSEFVRGFTLTAQEKQDLLTFLESLTDTEFLTDPRFLDPFASVP